MLLILGRKACAWAEMRALTEGRGGSPDAGLLMPGVDTGEATARYHAVLLNQRFRNDPKARVERFAMARNRHELPSQLWYQ